ncbi:MAG TPA: hypothetical protein VFN88_03975 [Caulobacteraceae bacterium]|nr:hypothetical protein [Caulobacteraceae bacterium]
MRNLCLSIVALTMIAAPAAAQTIPACPLASGVKDVSYAQAPDLLKQVFGKNRKISMPGGAFDAKSEDSQRVIYVRNRNNRWIVAYEVGGAYANRVAQFTISPTAFSAGPERDAQPDTLCEVANRQLGVPEAPTPQAQTASSPASSP